MQAFISGFPQSPVEYLNSLFFLIFFFFLLHSLFPFPPYLRDRAGRKKKKREGEENDGGW